jgi:hypothetical protein
MRNQENIFQFRNGKLEPLPIGDMPDWIEDALIAERERESEHYHVFLTEQGAEVIETYGMLNETLDVWRRQGFGWLIDYWDTTDHVMSVFITSVLDYVTFQATWISPVATKIIAADTYLRENEVREIQAEQAAARLN